VESEGGETLPRRDPAPECVIGMDAYGRVAYFDLAAQATFGYHRSEALGLHVADLIVPPRLRNSYRRTWHSGPPLQPGEMRGRRASTAALRADGSEVVVEAVVLELESRQEPRFVALVRASSPNAAAALTPREREVLGHVARGLTGHEIAEWMSISYQTVRTHVRNAMVKLDANTQAQAVAVAIRLGEINA
jgi:PAS domain S-box-containing protein